MIRSAWIRLALLVLVIGAASALAWGVRVSIVEPEAFAAACAQHAEGWRCALRDWTVRGFLSNSFGTTSLAMGLIATLVRWRWFALLAVVVGAVGAVLYRFELSGVGLLLGALVWMHAARATAPMTDAQHGGEQNA
jgi:hypothetical protein